MHQIAQPESPEHAGIDHANSGAADAEIVDDLRYDEAEVEAAQIEEHVETAEHE